MVGESIVYSKVLLVDLSRERFGLKACAMASRFILVPRAKWVPKHDDSQERGDLCVDTVNLSLIHI